MIAQVCPTCNRPYAASLQSILREARLVTGLSLADVGTRLTPPRAASTILRMERGISDIPANQLVQWARICGIDPAILFAQAVADADALAALVAQQEQNQ